MNDKIVTIRFNKEEYETLISRANGSSISKFIKDATIGSSETVPNFTMDATYTTPLEAEWLRFGKLCDINTVLDLLAMKSGKRNGDDAMNHWAVYLLMLLKGTETNTDDDPSLWRVVPNPDGNTEPWVNEDNQVMLVITDGKNEKVLYEDDVWFNLFVNK